MPDLDPAEREPLPGRLRLIGTVRLAELDDLGRVVLYVGRATGGVCVALPGRSLAAYPPGTSVDFLLATPDDWHGVEVIFSTPSEARHT